MLGRTLYALAGCALVVLTLTNCGGGYSDPPTTPGGSPGEPAATITITASGELSPKEVNIQVGQSVRFINQDSRAHQPTSNPHLQHTDCPAANLAQLSPGQSQTTAVFNNARACGIHDHLNPDTTSLHGVIRVGGAQGPGGPVY